MIASGPAFSSPFIKRLSFFVLPTRAHDGGEDDDDLDGGRHVVADDASPSE